ncbi:MAG TPA: iron-sulfur cluster insertion protein ErpA [Actinomycetota bacterium]|nr:iron-sulfur cluster insertion protein ErpA [Actinomycetota bacterium]
MTIKVSESAATKVRELLEREAPEQPMALRIAVQPGGCSGLRYALYFDDAVSDKDQTIEEHGVKVVVDKMSAPYLSGATIDYIDSLQQSGFTIDNPNAQSSCACGDSFH